MSQRLTQSEIDALLRRAGDTAPVATVLPWSFGRPARLAREKRLVFEGVLADTARAWQPWLSARLQLPIEVAPDAVEPVPMAQWLESFDEPACAFGFRLGGRADGHGVVDLGAGVAFAFVDRLLGGPGDPFGPQRPLTALEQALVRSVVDRLLDDWRDACRDRLALEPTITSYEPVAGSIAIAAADAPVLVSHLALRAPTFTGLIAIGVPLAAVEPLVAAPAPPPAAAPVVRSATRARMRQGLQQARVTGTVRLPAIRLKARAVLALRPGQVVETGITVGGAVELHVNGKPCFTGLLGQRNGRMALRVARTESSPVATAPGAPEGRNP